MRRIIVINALLLTALILGSLLAWPGLPERLPAHFRMDGTPDRWAERSMGVWFLPVVIAAFTAVLLHAVTQLSLSRPALINVPSKDRLLALPAELQRPVLEGIAICLHLTDTGVLVLFGLIQYGAWTTAHGGDGSASLAAALLIALVALPGCALAALVVAQRRIDQAEAIRAGRP